jgi:hypothetical protein
MGNNILMFVFLAICTNTVVPVPFETVFFYYFVKYPDFALHLVVIGSLGATTGSLIDLALATSIRKTMLKRFHQHTIEAGLLFYSIAFLFALLPLPFSVIRASLLRIRANPATFAATILPARLFKYLLLATAFRAWGLATGMTIGAVLLLIAWITNRYCFANRRILSGVLP